MVQQRQMILSFVDKNPDPHALCFLQKIVCVDLYPPNIVEPFLNIIPPLTSSIDVKINSWRLPLLALIIFITQLSSILLSLLVNPLHKASTER